MRKIIILALLMVLLAACSQLQGGTTSGESEQPPDGVGTAPTATATPTIVPTPTIPATFTPAPMVHNGHLYVVGGFSSGEYVVHQVSYGETLAILCEIYDVSVEQIARVNKLRNWNHIYVGQELRIPVPVSTDESG